MTNREAISLIKNEIQCVLTQRNCKRDCEHCPLIKPSGDIREAFEMAIKSLKLPRPSEDAVSRQVAIEHMASAIWHYPDYMALNSYDNAHELAEYGLRSVPPIKICWDCGSCMEEEYERRTAENAE